MGVIFTLSGIVLLAVGMILLTFGLLSLMGGMMSVPQFSIGGALSALWSVGFLAAGLQFMAMGSLFRLAIHVEENTRATAQCLEKLLSRLEPKAENIGSIFRSLTLVRDRALRQIGGSRLASTPRSDRPERPVASAAMAKK